MLSRPVMPKWKFRPMAARANAAVVGAKISRPPATRMETIWSMSAHPFRSSEDALRPHEQHTDEDHERGRDLEVSRQPQRRHLGHDADDERADERTEGVAQAAERHRGEHEE